jgi:hypothetical protein
MNSSMSSLARPCVMGVIRSMADGPKAGSSNRRAQVCTGGSELMGGAPAGSAPSPGWSMVTTPTSREENRSTSWAISAMSS